MGASNSGRRKPLTTGPITGIPQQQRGAQELGLCFRCGRSGHIAVNCTTPVGPYPLPQPVMSSVDISKPDTESAEVYESNKCANDVTAESVTHQGVCLYMHTHRDTHTHLSYIHTHSHSVMEPLITYDYGLVSGHLISDLKLCTPQVMLNCDLL